jgi:hypothetical protein
MYIFYTGIGCRPYGKHTQQEFVQLMKNLFIHQTYVPCIQEGRFKQWTLPHDFVHFTLEDWVEFSGAVIID